MHTNHCDRQMDWRKGRIQCLPQKEGDIIKPVKKCFLLNSRWAGFQWVSDWFLFKFHVSKFSDISWLKQNTFWWDDDEIFFVLYQHALLDFYCKGSLKQQSTGLHVTSLRHNIKANQSLLKYVNTVCLAKKQQYQFKWLVWPNLGSNYEPQIYLHLRWTCPNHNATKAVLNNFTGYNFKAVFFLFVIKHLITRAMQSVVYPLA